MQVPPGVYPKHGRYYAVIRNKWEPLTRIEEGEIALLEAYYTLTKSSPNTMAGVMIAFLKDGMGDLRPATQRNYRLAIISRLIPFCGHMVRNSLKPSHVAQMLEQRKREGAAVAGNRERAALASACNFGMRQGWLDFNPCLGVRRNKERPSKRYVTHEELEPQLDRAPMPLYHLLAAAYLTAARQTELREMKKDQLLKEGVRIIETKTGKERLVKWSPTLRKIFVAACERSTNDYVFVTAKGLPWGEWALQSAMRRFKPGFRFRDLRPKSRSDVAHNILSHDPGMDAVYKRRTVVSPVK
jgi:hypothetical protein